MYHNFQYTLKDKNHSMTIPMGMVDDINGLCRKLMAELLAASAAASGITIISFVVIIKKKSASVFEPTRPSRS